MQEFSVLTRMGAMFGVFVLAALVFRGGSIRWHLCRNGLWSQVQTWMGRKFQVLAARY